MSYKNPEQVLEQERKRWLKAWKKLSEEEKKARIRRLIEMYKICKAEALKASEQHLKQAGRFTKLIEWLQWCLQTNKLDEIELWLRD